MDWEPTDDGAPEAVSVDQRYAQYCQRIKRIRGCEAACHGVDADEAPLGEDEPDEAKDLDNEAELACVMQFVRDAATVPLCQTDGSRRLLCRDHVMQRRPVMRAEENEMLHTVGKNRDDRVCMNTLHRPSKCVANVLWPELKNMHMVEAKLEREYGGSSGGSGRPKSAARGDAGRVTPEDQGDEERNNDNNIGLGVDVSTEPSLRPCLLCLRQRIHCEAHGVIQDGCGSNTGMIISSHHNLVDVPGEYMAEDCVLPQTPHNGMIGACARVSKSKLRPVMSGCGRYWRIEQLYDYPAGNDDLF